MTTRILVPVLLLALGASCASQAKTTPDSGGSPSAAKEAKEAKRQLDLDEARLQLEIAQLEYEVAQTAADEAIMEARHELDEVQFEVVRFGQFERPTELESAQLSLDRAELSVRQNEAELQQMEEMYAAETNLDATGERTRDIVLERHRKALEFSMRQLELARERYDDQRERVLPRKKRELERKYEKARASLRKAEEKRDKGQLESKLALIKAEHRIQLLELEGKKKDEASGGDAK